jgi:pimeloyl-ACP methyl ester carboxylesterase
VRFQAAADLAVWGLRNRYRTSGVGAPLVASVKPVDENVGPQSRRVLPHVKVPVTAFLRIDSPHADLLQRVVHARLELYPADVTQTVHLPAGEIPLEIEWTTALAYTLSASRFSDIELLGFRGGDVRRALGLERLPDGLSMLQPHRRGRIPVVLVHGTASSPARWAEMVNELMSSRRIREAYEFWFFLYNTGNPVAYSGALLREALVGAVHDLDPDATDQAMAKMVVIGHSQGGLLAKLTVVHSGDRFWELVSDTPFEQATLTPGVRDILRRSLFVEPLPFIHRVVFIATPHHGSFLAARRISAIGRWLVRMPGQLASLGPELLSLPTSESRAIRRLRRIPSSVDNMTPGNPFLETLASLPIAQGVTAHSIIPVATEGPLAEGDDGVVEYKSAHIEGVESEKVVHSGHSTQGNPETILEVRRILLENLGAGS